ncbi:Hypothetical predicted protein [Pelobates cultripes]|uniref:Uncharacterized protein n=1 Tax=Pelobates cultripes TaxID=61616 RepID=A0AAD1SRA3_PELCU|nr:Hypothetical predicted protein [Pelobates cultripes]
MDYDTRQVVRIFSKERMESYRWLTLYLSLFIKDILPVSISNNQRDLKYYASRCHFAIVYHSKKRGRINVTDVADALYNKELRYLHRTIGKQNILVVIGDMDDSSESVKEQILQRQPSITKWAHGLFLFTEAEILSLQDYQYGPSVMDEKMEAMKKRIKGKRECLGYLQNLSKGTSSFICP